MRIGRLFLAATLATVTVAACARRQTVVVTPGPGRSGAALVLGVPPGQLPPPGRCRVWIPGRPAGRQPRAGRCDRITFQAPAGSWILYRPDADRRVVHVRYVDSARAGVIVLVRVFEVETGKYLRDERH